MADIADVAAYVCRNYPHKSELSKTRLTKLVYLGDWELAKRQGRQITGIRWYFHNYGPYVDDVFNAVESDGRFKIKSTKNHYGETKLEISVAEGVDTQSGLKREERDALDHVISQTSRMYWDDFIKHVYATEPITASERYSHLNLVELAHRNKVVA